MSQRVAIVGIGMTRHSSRRPYHNDGEMINEAVSQALADADLSMNDIENVVIGNMDLFEGHVLNDAVLADYTGAVGRSGMKMNTGGTVGTTNVISGWYNIASGMCDTTLIIGWEKHDEGNATSCMITLWEPALGRPFEVGAISGLSRISNYYMTRSGCPLEVGAIVRAQASENAARNPNAHLRDRYTVEDVMAARMVLYPLNLLMICPTSLGACAMVLASEKAAKKITDKPVWIKDHATAHQVTRGAAELTTDPKKVVDTSMTVTGRKVFTRNHITKPMEEIQVMEMYDPCAFCQPAWLEEFGICEPGQGWRLIENGVTARDGAFPVSPSGGVLCTNAIGDSGTVRVAEAALQLRGAAGEHQVTRKVKNALASGYGGFYYTDLFLLSNSLD
ncbi:MAG: thiolase family protein [Dehalococcoidia bacterium]|nr:thiolase family protein [Dehalococcoidia bacterium]